MFIGGSSIEKINEPKLVIDTLSIDWAAPGYLGNVFFDIPINGATLREKTDTLITNFWSTGMSFNVIKPGQNSVDTLTQYFNKGSPDNPQPNNDFWGQVLLYGKGDGSAVDSIKFELPL